MSLTKTKQKIWGFLQINWKNFRNLIWGKKVTTFNKLGKEYPIILQQYLSDRRNKEGISKIFVRSETNGKLVSLVN